MTEDLTRPERARAFAEANRLKDRIRADGGCCYCAHRSGLFKTLGRKATCGITPPRQFPKCLDEAKGFEVDPDALPRRIRV